MHIPNYATKFFDIATDVTIGLAAGAAGAAGFNKLAGLIKLARHPGKAPEALGEVLGGATQSTARGATQLHIRQLVRAKAPKTYEMLRKASDGWKVIADNFGQAVTTEDKVWKKIEEVYTEFSGTESEKDAQLIGELEYLEQFIESNDVRRFIEELSTTTSSELIQSFAFIHAKMQEHWPAVKTHLIAARAAIQPSGAVVSTIKSNHSALEARLAAVKAGGRRI